MTYKQMLVKEQIHQRAKAHAALLGLSIRAYAEEALLAKLDSFSLPPTVKESTETYNISTPTAPHASHTEEAS